MKLGGGHEEVSERASNGGVGSEDIWSQYIVYMLEVLNKIAF